MKSEPDAFSIDDLRARPRRTESWDGVRNYQARNFMRAMRAGDLAFFYHSSCTVPGIAGIIEIACAAYPDFTAWDPKNPHYDSKSAPDRPIWFMVDVRLRRKLKHPIALAALRANPKIGDMLLLRRGSRLSIQPVTPREWDVILKMEQA